MINGEMNENKTGTTGDKIRGTSVIFVNAENKVLLFLRDDKKEIPFPNCWDILGGRAEEGESPEQAIKREMLEELELDLRDPVLFGKFDMGDRIEHTFWKKADFDISEMTLHEGQRLGWFTEEEIIRMSDENLAFGFKTILLSFFRRKPFDDNRE